MLRVIVFFTLLACFSVVVNSVNVYNMLNNAYELQENKDVKSEVVKQAKTIVDEIEKYSKTLSPSLNHNEKLELIKKEINKINFNKYQEKAYAFDSLGFYIAHYSKDYENQNILQETDINNKLYVKDLVDKINNEGFTEASIFWTNHSIRHIITYVKKDENLNIYYGCTMDLDIFKINKENKKITRNENNLILISSFIVIIMILFFSFYQYKKRRKV